MVDARGLVPRHQHVKTLARLDLNTVLHKRRRSEQVRVRIKSICGLELLGLTCGYKWCDHLVELGALLPAGHLDGHNVVTTATNSKAKSKTVNGYNFPAHGTRHHSGHESDSVSL